MGRGVRPLGYSLPITLRWTIPRRTHAPAGLPATACHSAWRRPIRANKLLADFVRAKITEIVQDHAGAAKLTPQGLIGCKRLIIDSGYYATYNRPNVMLVDIPDAGQPIDRITLSGVQTAENHHDLDVLIFATGLMR